jgi:hypothetical protein
VRGSAAAADGVNGGSASVGVTGGEKKPSTEAQQTDHRGKKYMIANSLVHRIDLSK